MDLSGLHSRHFPGRSSDLRIFRQLNLPALTVFSDCLGSGHFQLLSPLTALAQRYGFAPYSLFITLWVTPGSYFMKFLPKKCISVKYKAELPY